jgi:hypothetical protein
MTDLNTPIEDRMAQMPRPAQLYYNQIMKQADEDIFTAIKDLRKSQDDGSIELELRPAANLALVTMTVRLNGDSLPRPKTNAEALADMHQRIERARLDGDQELYDSLNSGLAHAKAQAKKKEKFQRKRIAKVEASNQAFEDQKREKYETMVTESKDMEMQKIRRMGVKPDKAEAYYQEWSEKRITDVAQKTSGYTPHTPFEE